MKILLINKKPSLSLRLESLNGQVVRTHLALPEKEGFQLVYDPATISSPFLNDIVDWLTLYAKHKKPALCMPLDDSSCSPFIQAVLQQLRALPFGTSMSYTDVATRINRPQAARAVGNACGANPFPLFIPCHRVLARGGRLGGFSCGTEIKKRLLKFEEIPYK